MCTRDINLILWWASDIILCGSRKLPTSGGTAVYKEFLSPSSPPPFRCRCPSMSECLATDLEMIHLDLLTISRHVASQIKLDQMYKACSWVENLLRVVMTQVWITTSPQLYATDPHHLSTRPVGHSNRQLNLNWISAPIGVPVRTVVLQRSLLSLSILTGTITTRLSTLFWCMQLFFWFSSI